LLFLPGEAWPKDLTGNNHDGILVRLTASLKGLHIGPDNPFRETTIGNRLAAYSEARGYALIVPWKRDAPTRARSWE
jgi:hypothetical protein